MAKDSIGLSSYKYVACRYYGHAWLETEIFTGTEIENRPYGVPRSAVYEISTCNRCETRRHRYLDKDGSIYRRGYDYPKDYQIKSGEAGRRVAPVEFRVVHYQRLTMRRKNG